jgi:Fe-S-cluster containining protein
MSKNDKSKVKNKSKDKEQLPWYHEGLQFECTQCGACCSGEPGYVWVDESEIDAMAEELGLDFDAFERKFVRSVGKAKSLIEYSDGDCILLDPKTRKCTVYGARPIQCRTWPFWSSNLSKRKDWKETCEVCPGAGTGQLYTLEQVEAERKQKSV